MPNESNQLLENERRELNAIKTEHMFQPVNLNLKMNERFKEDRRYSVETVEQETALLQKMLGLSTTKELNLSAEETADYAMKLDRRMSFLLLNDEKTSGDSKEMVQVKKQLGILEFILTTQEVMNDRILDDIIKQYNNTILVCENYIKNKNPWFSTGKKRLAMVKDTNARLIREKDCLERGKELLKEGLIDETVIHNPLDLIRSENQKIIRKQIEEKKNDEFLKNVLDNEYFQQYFEQQKERNIAVKDEDKDVVLLLRYFVLISEHKTVKYVDGQKVPLEGDIKITPAMKDVGIAGNLEAKALAYGWHAGGHASRAFAGMVYYVKRDKDGNPLDAEEEEKANANEAYENCASELLDAKYACEKDPGNQEKADLYKQKAVAYMDLLVKRVDAFHKAYTWVTFKEIVNDPKLVINFFLKDPNSFNFMYHLVGLAQEMEQYCGSEVWREYMKDHPLLDYDISNLRFYGTMMTNLLRLLSHFNFSEGRVHPSDSDDEARMLKVLNKANATDAEKKEAREEYKDANKAIWDDAKDCYDLTVIDRDIVLLNRLKGVKRGSSEENNIIWMLENRITSQAQEIVKQRKKDGVPCTQEQAERMLCLRHAREYYNREDIKESLTMLDENVHRPGYQLSDAVSALLYLPKFDSQGMPLNKEEEEKDEWNKKWIEAWKYNNYAVKEECMKEGVVRVLNYKIPSPEEIKERGINYFIDKDPGYYEQLINNVNTLFALEKADPDTWNGIFASDKYLKGKYAALNGFVSYVTHFMSSRGDHITRNVGNNNDITVDFKEVSTIKNLSDEDIADSKAFSLQLFDDYESAYKQATNFEAQEKWVESNYPEEVLQSKIQEAQAIQPQITREGVLLSLKLQETINQLHEFDEIATEAKKLKLIAPGDVSRLLACAFYHVKRDNLGNPLNAEEKRKAEHNEKWKAAWKRWVKANNPTQTPDPLEAALENKKARQELMMCYALFCRDMVNYNYPKPEDFKNGGEKFRKLVTDDPFAFREIESFGAGFDAFNNLFKGDEKIAPEIAQIMKQIPDYEIKRKMGSYMVAGIAKLPIYDYYKIQEEKRIPNKKVLDDNTRDFLKQVEEQTINLYKDEYNKLNKE